LSLKASAFFAASLDGYIARQDGSIDWLNDANAAIPEGEDCGYRALMDTVDTLVMGRNTHEQVLTLGPWFPSFWVPASRPSESWQRTSR